MLTSHDLANSRIETKVKEEAWRDVSASNKTKHLNKYHYTLLIIYVDITQNMNSEKKHK